MCTTDSQNDIQNVIPTATLLEYDYNGRMATIDVTWLLDLAKEEECILVVSIILSLLFYLSTTRISSPSQVITTFVDKLRPSKVSFHFYPKFKEAFPTKSIANPMANKSIREQGLYGRRKEQRRRKVKMLECWRWWRFADRLYWIRECLLSVVAST